MIRFIKKIFILFYYEAYNYILLLLIIFILKNDNSTIYISFFLKIEIIYTTYLITNLRYI